MLEKPGCFGGNSLRAKKLSQVKRKHNGSVFAAVGADAGAGRGAVAGAALPSHDAIYRSMSH